jgi:hypothetical protein
MGLRFSCKIAAVVQGGTTFLHGLAQIPSEWKFNLRGPSPGAAVLYLAATPTSTNIIVAASGAAGTGDIFCHVNHTFIQ